MRERHSLAPLHRWGLSLRGASCAAAARAVHRARESSPALLATVRRSDETSNDASTWQLVDLSRRLQRGAPGEQRGRAGGNFPPVSSFSARGPFSTVVETPAFSGCTIHRPEHAGTERRHPPGHPVGQRHGRDSIDLLRAPLPLGQPRLHRRRRQHLERGQRLADDRLPRLRPRPNDNPSSIYFTGSIPARRHQRPLAGRSRRRDGRPRRARHRHRPGPALHRLHPVRRPLRR